MAEYRLKMFGAISDSEWFDNKNTEANSWRVKCNTKATDDVEAFLNTYENGIAILDSTNPTHTRRIELLNKIRPTGAKSLFIEVTNDNEEFLAEQLSYAVTAHADFQGMSSIDAVKAYRRRIEKYAIFYETLNADNR